MNNNIIIRKEEEKDYYQTEQMTRRAFWNRYKPGCDEHYLVYNLRQDPSYLPAYSRVAVLDDEVIGCIMYSQAYVLDGDIRHAVVTFGPLCVDPDYQRHGIGARLVQETAALAAADGYPGIIIFGEETYYPRLGFKTCDHFGITTRDGKNVAAFMGYELKENAMAAVRGTFHIADVYEKVSRKLVDEYDRKFPYMEKLTLPGQWDQWDIE